MPEIFLIEDDPTLSKNLRLILEEEGYQVKSFSTAEEVLKDLSSHLPDLVITDIKLPGKSGLDILSWLNSHAPDIPVIIITAFATLDNAIQALRLGARDYIKKPFQPEEILMAIKKVLSWERLKEENVWLRQELERRDRFEELVGKSEAMQEVYRKIEKVALADIPVLITGESGTGKELVARAIHRRSKRKNGRFIPVNCGAIPETLMESELFGHEKGAFTSAGERKKGLLEVSDGGTLFLDEIGNLPLPLQAKMLRFLQDGEFFRVGGTTPLKVNTRIISATNRDLEEEVKKGNFREDLYYRVQGVSIHLPPLRERKEDIPLLVEHFRKKYNREAGNRKKKFSREVMDRFLSYPWPGNVRELENVVRACLVLSDTETIQVEDLPPRLRGETHKEKTSLTLIEEREKSEREYLIRILRETGGNISRASRIAGISRRHFYKKLRDYGIEPEKWRKR